jgi:hypothetical protein
LLFLWAKLGAMRSNSSCGVSISVSSNRMMKAWALVRTTSFWSPATRHENGWKTWRLWRSGTMDMKMEDHLCPPISWQFWTPFQSLAAQLTVSRVNSMQIDLFYVVSYILLVFSIHWSLQVSNLTIFTVSSTGLQKMALGIITGTHTVASKSSPGWVGDFQRLNPAIFWMRGARSIHWHQDLPLTR